MAKVKGLGKWLGYTEKISEEVQEQANEVVKRTAYKIERSAKKNAPVKTGYLRNHIKTHIDGSHAKVVSHAEYSIYVEFGTSKMPPQPYMIPAYFMHIGEFENLMRDIAKKVGD